MCIVNTERKEKVRGRRKESICFIYTKYIRTFFFTDIWELLYLEIFLNIYVMYCS
jgi:hypothetical protein